jgi:hypothetical protein
VSPLVSLSYDLDCSYLNKYYRVDVANTISISLLVCPLVTNLLDWIEGYYFLKPQST